MKGVRIWALLMQALRGKAEEIRAMEVDKAMSRLGDGMTKKQMKAIEEMSRGIVNKLLHGPMTALRCDGSDPNAVGETLANMEALERMFSLSRFELPAQRWSMAMKFWALLLPFFFKTWCIKFGVLGQGTERVWEWRLRVLLSHNYRSCSHAILTNVTDLFWNQIQSFHLHGRTHCVFPSCSVETTTCAIELAMW